MSQISGFNPLNPSQAARTTPNQFSEMSTEDFIRVIFTELTNQDPFEPTDSTALLQQLSSIRSIESDLRLTQQLKSLVTENQLASAGNLIGKFVGGLNTENQRVAGFAVAVSREGDSVKVELDSGWMIPIKNIETIIDPSIFGDGSGSGDENGNGQSGDAGDSDGSDSNDPSDDNDSDSDSDSDDD